MKKIYLIIVTVLITSGVYAQTGWIQSNIGNVKLVSINFINENTGYIFGRLNKFYKTTDMGEIWEEINTPSQALSGNFTDDRVGILIGGYPYVTTDGGLNWIYGGGIEPTPGSSGATFYFKSGFMLNKDTGYVCGNEFGMIGVPLQFYVIARIYWTTTGGQNWELVSEGGFDWYDIKIDKNGKLYCVWSSLITSIDYGESWQYIAGINPFAESLSEIFGDTVYVSGAAGRIGRSFNGGYNWSIYQTASNDTLNKVFFLDNKTGWITGDSGYILHTINAGTNWTKQNTPTVTDVNSIYFINKDTGFAVGDNGLFLKTFTGGAVGIRPVSLSVPEKYSLYQNYPNPFNPSTVIRFDIAKNEHVKLVIYDVSGKVVSVLVNEPLNYGSYEYEFNAAGFPSGVYIYQLRSGSFKETKRMVLVK